MSLILTIVISYFMILQSGGDFETGAYKAASSDDLPGIGDAAFEFKFNLILAPVGGVVIYALSRLILWSISRIRDGWQLRKKKANS